jgi:hypothetical protein
MSHLATPQCSGVGEWGGLAIQSFAHSQLLYIDSTEHYLLWLNQELHHVFTSKKKYAVQIFFDFHK